jgi:hypothetical protein
MDAILQMVGALFPTRLFSWLFLRVFRGHPSAHTRIVRAHLASLALGWIMRAWGDANGGGWQWASGFLNVLPQLVWYLWDRRKLASARQRETV